MSKEGEDYIEVPLLSDNTKNVKVNMVSPDDIRKAISSNTPDDKYAVFRTQFEFFKDLVYNVWASMGNERSGDSNETRSYE